MAMATNKGVEATSKSKHKQQNNKTQSATKPHKRDNQSHSRQSHGIRHGANGIRHGANVTGFVMEPTSLPPLPNHCHFRHCHNHNYCHKHCHCHRHCQPLIDRCQDICPSNLHDESTTTSSNRWFLDIVSMALCTHVSMSSCMLEHQWATQREEVSRHVGGTRIIDINEPQDPSYRVDVTMHSFEHARP